MRFKTRMPWLSCFVFLAAAIYGITDSQMWKSYLYDGMGQNPLAYATLGTIVLSVILNISCVFVG